jgi:hypothetical protein
MSKGAIIARIISEYSDKGTKAAKRDLEQSGKDFSNFAANVKKSFFLAGAAAAAFAVKIGVDSLKAALADQKSQAVLANTLRNTTGANKEAIEATQAYIKATELRLGITDEELRPSLAALVTATHNVTEAEKIQQVAMDISAARHKDLSAVSIALSKAYLGNFTALKKLAIPLSQSLIDTKNFQGALDELSASVHGSATVAADTLSGRLERVQLGFEEAKKSLGEALMPTLEHFINILNDNLLPKLQEWVEVNKEQIAKTLEKVGNYLMNVVGAAIKFGAWIASHIALIKELGIVMAAIWAYDKVYIFVTALTGIVSAFNKIKTAAEGAAFFESLATGGASIAAGLAAIAVLGLGTAFLQAGSDAETASQKFANSLQKGSDVSYYGRNRNDLTPKIAPTAPPPFSNDMASVVAQNQLLISQTAQQKIQEKITNDKKAQQVLDAKAASDAAAAAKRQADEAAKQLKINKELLAIKKLGGGTAQSTDLIELEAARLNLVKQGNVLELEKLKAMKDAADLQKTIADSAQRYSDILSVIADGKVTSEEIALLAHKWGDTTSEVENYVARVIGANSTKANTDSVLALYESWGLTQEQATKYRDFAKALSDQKLSDQEITNLENKWNLSKEQVLKYAKAVENGTVFDVTKITTPGDAAAAGWKNALNSLNDYLTAAKSGTGGVGGVDVGGSAMLGGRTNEIGGNLGSGGVADTMASLFSAINAPTASFATSGFLAGASGTATGSTGGSSTPVNVTVNVAGSVTSQNDLTEAIRANLQNGLLSGRALGFNTAGL